MVITPEGVIARYFPGIEYLDRGANGQLLQDPSKTLRLTLVEAGQGQIGTASDRVFLSCYQYNPHTGKYSANVRLIMQAGGILTLLIIAGFYAKTSWRIPGFRVLVVGVLAYIALLPVIMYTAMPVERPAQLGAAGGVRAGRTGGVPDRAVGVEVGEAGPAAGGGAARRDGSGVAVRFPPPRFGEGG